MLLWETEFLRCPSPWVEIRGSVWECCVNGFVTGDYGTENQIISLIIQEKLPADPFVLRGSVEIPLSTMDLEKSKPGDFRFFPQILLEVKIYIHL